MYLEMNFHYEPSFIDPIKWGPSFWHAIEGVVISMDNQDHLSKEYVYLFLFTLQNVLPCPDCRNHYQQYFQSHDVKKRIHDKKKMFQWIYDLKKQIKIQNKESFQQTFPEYLQSVKQRFFE